MTLEARANASRGSADPAGGFLARARTARRSDVRAPDVLRLGQLYRGVCSDLMLAESYDLPRDTVAYLHGLVGRAHNVLYRAQGFRFRDWGRVLFDSDHPFLTMERALEAARSLALDDGPMADFLGGTAERLLEKRHHG